MYLVLLILASAAAYPEGGIPHFPKECAPHCDFLVAVADYQRTRIWQTVYDIWGDEPFQLCIAPYYVHRNASGLYYALVSDYSVCP